MPIETVTLDALDGACLHADLLRVDDAIGSVVLSHPHPLYGGDRFNAVVDTLFRSLPEAGLTTIRFDFRGVNESTGEHDDGDSERLDIVAAIELLEIAEPNAPLWLVGYSFGAIVALNVVDPRIEGWIAIAPPIAATPGRFLSDGDHRPKLLLVAAHDQFSPPAATAEATAGWRNVDLRTIESADHFLGGRTALVADLVVEYLREGRGSST